MGQLRKVSIVVALVATILTLISGAVLFFLFEPPFLASVFLACAIIAIACFVIAAVAAYLEE